MREEEEKREGKKWMAGNRFCKEECREEREKGRKDLVVLGVRRWRELRGVFGIFSGIAEEVRSPVVHFMAVEQSMKNTE